MKRILDWIANLFKAKKVIFYYRDENECDFAVIAWVRNKRQIKLCKKLIKAGVDAWHQASNGNYENKYFTVEEIDSFYWAGYAEPASELLNRHHIRHKVLNPEYNTLPDDAPLIYVD